MKTATAWRIKFASVLFCAFAPFFLAQTSQTKADDAWGSSICGARDLNVDARQQGQGSLINTHDLAGLAKEQLLDVAACGADLFDQGQSSPFHKVTLGVTILWIAPRVAGESYQASLVVMIARSRSPYNDGSMEFMVSRPTTVMIDRSDSRAKLAATLRNLIHQVLSNHA